MSAKLTIQQIFNLARDSGLSPDAAVTATAIALAESSGYVHNDGDVTLEDATWGPSKSLWQIRSARAETGKGTARDVTQLDDPLFNAHSMAQISGHGANWHPWTTYTNGAYKRYLPQIYAALGISGAHQAPARASAGPLPASTSTGAASPAAASMDAAINTGGAFGWVANLAVKLGFALLGLGLLGAAAWRAASPAVKSAAPLAEL